MKGEGMEYSRKISEDEWDKIYRECVKSIDN